MKEILNQIQDIVCDKETSFCYHAITLLNNIDEKITRFWLAESSAVQV